MKTRVHITLIIATVIAALVRCSEDQKLNYDQSKVPQYWNIINNLKPNGYVPYFRMFKNSKFDFEQWKINSDESQFLRDSMTYYQAREDFFNQDREFLHWLLSFKNDTVIDSSAQQRLLWSEFVNPYRSYLPYCSFAAPKSKQAINLIYGFLNGSKIVCVECTSGKNDCALTQYEYVETFISKYKDATIEELREVWEPD